MKGLVYDCIAIIIYSFISMAQAPAKHFELSVRSDVHHAPAFAARARHSQVSTTVRAGLVGRNRPRNRPASALGRIAQRRVRDPELFLGAR